MLVWAGTVALVTLVAFGIQDLVRTPPTVKGGPPFNLSIWQTEAVWQIVGGGFGLALLWLWPF